MINKPLGLYIKEQTDNIQEEIEQELESLSSIEWAVNVNYSYNTTSEGKISDALTATLYPYKDNLKQGKFVFEFTSLEAIFLKGLCELMYGITEKPEDYKRILNHSKYTLKVLEISK